MSERIEQTSGFVEAVRNGTIENLQMVALDKPPRGVLGGEELMGYLDESGVVKAVAAAIHVFNLESDANGGLYAEHEPDIVKKRSVEKGFHCGFLTTFGDKAQPPSKKGRSVVYLQGIRKTRVDPHRRGPFDYAYRLELPVRSHPARDFRVDLDGIVKVHCSSSALNVNYNSRTSDYYIGSEELTSVLQEAIGDLIGVVQDKKVTEEERRDMPIRLESFMKIDASLSS